MRLPSGVVPGAVVVSEATVGGEAAPVPGVGRGQGGGQEAQQQTASEAGAGLQQRPGTIRAGIEPSRSFTVPREGAFNKESEVTSNEAKHRPRSTLATSCDASCLIHVTI